MDESLVLEQHIECATVFRLTSDQFRENVAGDCGDR